MFYKDELAYGKLNDNKSGHVNFKNMKEGLTLIPVSNNRKVVPYANSAKYLGMTPNTKLCTLRMKNAS